MSEIQRQEYRDRLHEGQVVYFAQPNNILGVHAPDSTLIAKKATVTGAEEGRRYPLVLIWDDVSSDPKGTGIIVGKSPRELFTVEELQSLIVDRKEFQNKIIDDLVKDAVSNERLAYILSGVARERLGDDHKRNPRDPEY